MEYLLNPTVNSNKESVVFGVMQATCQPGQKTRKGYVGELDVNLRYALKGSPFAVFPSAITNITTIITNITTTGTNITAVITNTTTSVTNYVVLGSSNIVARTSPRVLGVLPLMDTKNLEFRNSNKSQIELALALQAAFAAKGLTAAASLLSDYVKREQANVDTRNQNPVVTTYADNDSFGFQIYPALRAVEQPGKSSSKAGFNLEPVTFPLVVAIMVDKDQVASKSLF